MTPNAVICVKFYKLDTLVKFRYYSFIGCRATCENALLWIKLEVPPNKWGFFRTKSQARLPPKHVLGALSVNPSSVGYLVEVKKEIKKTEKSTRGYIFTPIPTVHM